MREIVLKDDLTDEITVKVSLRRSARARRLSLRVSRLDGRVTLTLPQRAHESDALSFLDEKRDWILRHLKDRPHAAIPAEGAYLPFLGQNVLITRGTSRAARLEEGRLIVPGEAARIPVRVKAFLKLQAQLSLRNSVETYARKFDVEVGRITLRDTRSRWGSCTSEGNLMFSWRLVMAPQQVLDYVAAHEVAHRLEMNHSDRFWAHVERVCPDYRELRGWLHAEGENLHAWCFDTLEAD